MFEPPQLYEVGDSCLDGSIEYSCTNPQTRIVWNPENQRFQQASIPPVPEIKICLNIICFNFMEFTY